ncbi:MAG: N(G),N(G)-dimethylarginine dimethylaminohydrolase [Oscillospiraceae bacterium]|nr:N(G),N(G)-dimethylarginine dimethylaminohydrolase [Oscillospiraceae bacterium]
MFTHAIVKKPCQAMVDGITTADLGKPDYQLAIKQHADYIQALEQCGVQVTVLEADEAYPDSCFVEDTAVLTRKFALITNPGTPSRKGEIMSMIPVIERFYPKEAIEYIQAPGTLEGGDIMMVGDHFYIGISARTNQEGAQQFIRALEKHGMSGEMVPLHTILHLKTGLSYIENNNLLISGEFLDNPTFSQFHHLKVAVGEEYGANCIWVNGKVLVPAGYPQTQKAIEALGYEVLVVDTSEYRKIDGGLSCLSLRF